MDLHNVKVHGGLKRSWARNAALLLFLVTGIILVASLTTAHSNNLDARTSLLADGAFHTFKLL